MSLAIVIMITLAFSGPRSQYFEMKIISQTVFANIILIGIFAVSIICFLNDKKKYTTK